MPGLKPKRGNRTAGRRLLRGQDANFAGLGCVLHLRADSQLAKTARVSNPLQDGIPMSLSFAGAERSEVVVGRTPWSAADALVGLPASCKMLISSYRLRVHGTRADQGVRPTTTWL